MIGVAGIAAALVLWPKGSAAPGVYEWRLSERVRNDIPYTHVTLVAESGNYDLGEYQGACVVEEGEYLAYETSKVICWYAGKGHELGVFEEPGQTVVREIKLDEGVSGIPGIRSGGKLVLYIR